MSDIGNRCVHCGEDTSFGSGRFVNRIPADADYEATDSEGKVIFAEGEYRDGYACAECMALPCDRCDELIPLDYDLCPYDVYDKDDPRSSGEFADGAFRVHYKCLTHQEKLAFCKMKEE
jgi:hypothetical protein